MVDYLVLSHENDTGPTPTVRPKIGLLPGTGTVTYDQRYWGMHVVAYSEYCIGAEDISYSLLFS